MSSIEYHIDVEYGGQTTEYVTGPVDSMADALAEVAEHDGSLHMNLKEGAEVVIRMTAAGSEG